MVKGLIYNIAPQLGFMFVPSAQKPMSPHRGEIYLLTFNAVLHRNGCQAAVHKGHTPLQRGCRVLHSLQQRKVTQYLLIGHFLVI